MKFEIFGMGCANCERLTRYVQKAVEELGIEAEIVKVEDFEMLIRRGITMTPGLAIDGEVRSMGRVPSIEEIREMIEETRQGKGSKPTTDPAPEGKGANPTCGCSNGTNLLYSCSGASNVGQITNEAAKSLAAHGLGKFSCLAGVGSHGGGFISSAKKADRIICLDGCAVKCAHKTLTHAGIEPTIHIVVTDLGIKKDYQNLHPLKDDVDRVAKKVQSQL